MKGFGNEEKNNGNKSRNKKKYNFSKTFRNTKNSTKSKKELIEKATKLHSDGNIKEALKYYEYFIAENFNEPVIFSNYSIILKNKGKLKEAEISLKKALKIDPNFFDAHLNLGSLLEHAGKLKEAAESTNNAIILNPNSVKAHYNLSNIFRKLGNLDYAEKSIRKALNLDPNFINAYLNLGSILKDIGNLKDAESSTRMAIKINPNFAEAYCNLGNILEEAGKIEDAKTNWIKAISLSPNLEDASLQLARQLYFQKDYELAIKYLKNCKSDQCQTLLLGCLLCIENEEEFNRNYRVLFSKGICNADIGGIIEHANCIYDTTIDSTFCNKSIDYIYKDKINNILFSDDHLNQLISYVKSDYSIKRSQSLLHQGLQTSGNLLSLEYPFIKSLKKALEFKINSYKIKFIDSNQGFINNWPNNYELRAWLVSMKSGGFLHQHNHEYGWITGSFYLQIPNNMNTKNQGSITFSYQGPNYPSKNKDFNLTTKKVEKRDILIFPSSLFHSTIPFSSSEERICFVFDLIQKD